MEIARKNSRIDHVIEELRNLEHDATNYLVESKAKVKTNDTKIADLRHQNTKLHSEVKDKDLIIDSFTNTIKLHSSNELPPSITINTDQDTTSTLSTPPSKFYTHDNDKPIGSSGTHRDNTNNHVIFGIEVPPSLSTTDTTPQLSHTPSNIEAHDNDKSPHYKSFVTIENCDTKHRHSVDVIDPPPKSIVNKSIIYADNYVNHVDAHTTSNGSTRRTSVNQLTNTGSNKLRQSTTPTSQESDKTLKPSIDNHHDNTKTNVTTDVNTTPTATSNKSTIQKKVYNNTIRYSMQNHAPTNDCYVSMPNITNSQSLSSTLVQNSKRTYTSIVYTSTIEDTTVFDTNTTTTPTKSSSQH